MKDVILIIAAMEDVELDYLISKLKNLKKLISIKSLQIQKDIGINM